MISKPLYASLFLALAAHTVSASVLTEQFDRADTTPTSSTSSTALGNSWKITNASADPNPTWAISGNSLRAVPATSGKTSFLTNANTSTGSAYTAQTDFSFNAYSSNAWFGLAFNFQDSSHYWMLRVKATSSTSQQLQVVYNNGSGETTAGLSNWNYSFNSTNYLSSGTTYTMSISVADSSYSWVILQGSTTVASGTMTANTANASVPTFTGGQVGYYLNAQLVPTTSSFTFDNFSTNAAVPEPAALSILAPAVAGLLMTRKH